ncbi:hypothetical protein JCM8547_005530 [Rhodosporidiobolus lusitaniae]
MAPLIDAPSSATEPQWYFSKEELARAPSVRAGMAVSDERRQRQKACRVVWQLRDGLQLKQATVTTAITLLNRFYMRRSFQDYDHLIGAGAAVFLASKNEEDLKSTKHLVQVLLDLKRNTYRRGYPTQPETKTPEFDKLRRKLAVAEEAMLNTLCFDLTVRHPHWLAVQTAERVWRDEPEKAEEVASVAWALLNDSLATQLCILRPPQTVAAAALALACSHLSLSLPIRPPSLGEQRTLHDLDAEQAEEGEEAPPFVPEVFWLDLLDVSVEELQETVEDLLEGYNLAQDEFVRKEGEILAGKALPLLASLGSSAPPLQPTLATPTA